jgi:hypothetical protein
MDNYGVEKGEPPIDSQAQDHDVDKERHDDILEEHRMAFYEFPGPERVEKALGEIGGRIIFQVKSHGF